MSVAVTPAVRMSLPYTLEATGTVTPLETSAVAAQVDGIVTDVLFDEGQEVTKGQLLFKIDPRPYEVASQQAKSVLARDGLAYESAKVEADRYTSLQAERVVTTEQADQMRATAATARGQLVVDSASVATAKFNLDNTTVRAPISGRTGALLVREGNLARAAGGTPMVVINQVRPIVVRFAMPGDELPMILHYGKNGGLAVHAAPSSAAVPTGASSVSPTDVPLLDAAPSVPMGGAGSGAARGGGRGGGRGGSGAGGSGAGGSGAGGGGGAGGRGSGRGRGANAAAGDSGKASGGAAGRGPRAASAAAKPAPADAIEPPAEGTLFFIDNAVDTTTGTVQLKAKFDNANGMLWAGQFVGVTLQLFVEQNALVVPAQCVVRGQTGTFVYVIDSTNKAEQRPVVVERTTNGISVVVSGLRDGERVVTDGQSRLSQGATVDLSGGKDSSGGRGRGGRGRGGRGGGRGASGAAGGAAGAAAGGDASGGRAGGGGTP